MKSFSSFLQSRKKKFFLIKLSQEGLTDRKSMYAQIQEIQKYQGLETF